MYLFFVSLTIHSQNEILHFSTVNGLPHDLTYEVFQDADGFIWIGTDNGIVKYDGQTFQMFDARQGLESNFVIAIEQLSDSTLVFGTWGGGLQFVKNDSIQNWTREKSATLKINNLHAIGNTLYSSYGYRNLKIQLQKPGQELQQQYIGFKGDSWASIEGAVESNDPLVAFSRIGNTLYGHHQLFLGPDIQNPRNKFWVFFSKMKMVLRGYFLF